MSAVCFFTPIKSVSQVPVDWGSLYFISLGKDPEPQKHVPYHIGIFSPNKKNIALTPATPWHTLQGTRKMLRCSSNPPAWLYISGYLWALNFLSLWNDVLCQSAFHFWDIVPKENKIEQRVLMHNVFKGFSLGWLGSIVSGPWRGRTSGKGIVEQSWLPCVMVEQKWSSCFRQKA